LRAGKIFLQELHSGKGIALVCSHHQLGSHCHSYGLSIQIHATRKNALETNYLPISFVNERRQRRVNPRIAKKNLSKIILKSLLSPQSAILEDLPMQIRDRIDVCFRK